ncbi:MAG TPA: ATP-binding cassette domain-containing protein, partial [Thermoanaerobaculia bacterium]|nr:ATP-binding cassette domain-containing protein [Thermoanaerobaculia bacterium]
MTGEAIRVESLTKRFGTVTAVDDLSFSVSSGELFGLIGPDGAGKTTLLRILATLLIPDRGHATVLGHDVVAGLWDLRPLLGYMPGRFSLYPDLSVQENLSFFASVFGTT